MRKTVYFARVEPQLYTRTQRSVHELVYNIIIITTYYNKLIV